MLTLLVAFRLSLPAITVQYNNHGRTQQDRGEITSALRSLRRAISLAPDLAVAHYNLAGAAENLGDYAAAVSEYRLAREAAPRRDEIYNNLAQLYLLAPEESVGRPRPDLQVPEARPAGAWRPLLPDQERRLGRARSRFLHVAERDLREAIQLDADGPAPHCLLAQVLEARRERPAAAQEWGLCRFLAPGRENEMAPSWLSQAEERLSARGNP